MLPKRLRWMQLFKSFDELEMVMEEQAARRGKLERRLKDIGFKHQGPDVVVLQDLCRALELPIAKSDGGGLKRPELEKQIVVSLLAEVDDGARKAALVDATLQELRRVNSSLLWFILLKLFDSDSVFSEVSSFGSEMRGGRYSLCDVAKEPRGFLMWKKGFAIL